MSPRPDGSESDVGGGGRRRIPSWLVTLARLAVVLLVVGAVAWVGADNAQSLRHLHFALDWPWFLAAAPASMAAGLFMPLGWRLLLRAFGSEVGVRASLRVWWTAQVARYVPTGTVALATRVVLAAREGVPRMLAGVSLPCEVAVVVGWGTVLTGALLPSHLLAAWARLVVAAAAAGGLILLPWLLRMGARVIPRMPEPVARPGMRRAIYGSEAWYAVNSLFRTAAFVLLVHGLEPVHWSDVALLAGSFNAAAVAGLVSIAPGGLGVREGILTLVLRTRYGFGDAAGLAIALRGWDVAIDLLWLAAARIAGRLPPTAPGPSDLDLKST